MKNKVASLSPLVAATLVCTAAVYASWSAPIMPGPARLGDMVKSLRKLHSVYLKVHVVSPQADRAGIPAEKIRARWAQRLTTTGFDVADEDSPRVARLELIVRSAEKRKEQSMAVSFQMSLHQRVTIARTGQKLKVPTYFREVGGLEDDRDNFAQAMQQNLDDMLARFIAECNAARR